MKQPNHHSILVENGKMRMTLISPRLLAAIQDFIADTEQDEQARKVAVEVKRDFKEKRSKFLSEKFRCEQSEPRNKPIQLEFDFEGL